MRAVRFLPVGILFLAASMWGAQALQSTGTAVQSAAPAVRDPKAVAAVQGAISALGGVAAITQPASWSFQGIVKNQWSTLNVQDIVNTTAGLSVATGGKALPQVPPWARAHSHFLPAVVGAILVQDFQTSLYSMEYLGPVTLDSQSVVAVTFSLPNSPSTREPVRYWYFDSSTNLPAQVRFVTPTQVGQTEALRGVVDFANYQAVGGALYPFQINIAAERQPLSQITIQSVRPSPTAQAGHPIISVVSTP